MTKGYLVAKSVLETLEECTIPAKDSAFAMNTDVSTKAIKCPITGEMVEK
jgi:hypothetical protein